jgi:magnesium chelatase family protein
MSLATTHCRAASGIAAPAVSVEAHLANGLPAFHIVGLPEKAVQESRDRVRGALLNSGFEFPARRITVNLAPADLPKEGSRFDLAIAVGILAASAQIPGDKIAHTELLGELALSGQLRPVPGALPVALAAHHAGHALILPEPNLAEAALARAAELHPASSLLAVCAHLAGQQPLPLAQPGSVHALEEHGPDLAEVRGQAHAKRALEIVAAGGHHLLMSGPPGSGKSMLARRLPGLLPDLSEQEALEAAALRSVSGQPLDPARWRQRPFRAPHHTASGVALVGGGSHPRPGEVSLAHHGVLFLDELPEFDRRVLEVLREPLENGHITVSRAARQADYPSRFQLVAAMNPCPCGHLGDPTHACHCTAEQVARYRGRLSGPLLDRIDLQLSVPALPPHAMTEQAPATEASSEVRRRVVAARAVQQHRQGCSNAQLQGMALDRYCRLDAAGRDLLHQAMARLGLSARGYHRVLRIARSIADLAGCEAIQIPHLTEAIGYRRLDAAPR